LNNATLSVISLLEGKDSTRLLYRKLILSGMPMLT